MSSALQRPSSIWQRRARTRRRRRSADRAATDRHRPVEAGSRRDTARDKKRNGHQSSRPWSTTGSCSWGPMLSRGRSHHRLPELSHRQVVAFPCHRRQERGDLPHWQPRMKPPPLGRGKQSHQPPRRLPPPGPMRHSRKQDLRQREPGPCRRVAGWQYWSIPRRGTAQVLEHGRRQSGSRARNLVLGRLFELPGRSRGRLFLGKLGRFRQCELLGNRQKQRTHRRIRRCEDVEILRRLAHAARRNSGQAAGSCGTPRIETGNAFVQVSSGRPDEADRSARWPLSWCLSRRHRSAFSPLRREIDYLADMIPTHMLSTPEPDQIAR